MRLISILSGKGFVMYNKELAHKVSVNGSIIFGQLCSSYESFGSKGMLTMRDSKEYFFLTSETIYEETALTYKQQMKAVKELESSGYIETKIMGVPSKKHFHITDKIINELLPSSDKREDLGTPQNPAPALTFVSPSNDKREELEQQELQNGTASFDKRSTLALPKDTGKPLQKGSSIKKKNKKEKDKENNNNTTSSRESIDNQLREQYPNVPFKDVKEQVINDNSITIETNNQYEAILNYRLKTWKPNSNKKVTRKEMLPEWFDDTQYNVPKVIMNPEELEKTKAEIQAMLELL